MAGLAQVLWYVGAIAPLIIGIAFLGLGDWLPRVLFAQLFVVALVTWALRQGMVESELWAKAQKEAGQAAGAFGTLFQRRHVRALSFLIVMYGVWNLVAGTYGFFFPYILEAVGNTSERANYTLQAIWFLSTALAVGTIYMPRIDRVSGRSMLVWASVLQVAGSSRSSCSRSASSRR